MIERIEAKLKGKRANTKYPVFFSGLLHIDQINNLINERITIKACNECTDFLISNQRRKKKERGLAARTYSSVINWSEDNTRSGWSPWMNLLYILPNIITYNTYVYTLIFHAMWKISFHSPSFYNFKEDHIFWITGMGILKIFTHFKFADIYIKTY